jgi:hypothetical protein
MATDCRTPAASQAPSCVIEICTVQHPTKSCQHRASSLCTLGFDFLRNRGRRWCFTSCCPRGQGGPPPHQCKGNPKVTSYGHIPPPLNPPFSLFPSCQVTWSHSGLPHRMKIYYCGVNACAHQLWGHCRMGPPLLQREQQAAFVPLSVGINRLSCMPCCEGELRMCVPLPLAGQLHHCLT